MKRKPPKWSRAYSVIKWRQDRNKVGSSREERIALLKKWAEYRAPTPAGETALERRERYRRMGKKRCAPGKCWVCRGWGNLFNHHVIQIQNGGHNWELNIERICGECHREIHPWLPKPTVATHHIPAEELPPF